MKKIILLSFLLLIILNQYAQTITLSFTAKDAATQNSIALDRVHVQNQAVGCDTTVYGESPILVIPVHLGIDEPNLGSGPQLLSNVPNPFNSVTMVEVYLPFRDHLRLLLTDNLGKHLTEYHGDLAAGNHQFKIHAGCQGLLLLNVLNNKSVKTIKLINTATLAGKSSISKLESMPENFKHSSKASSNGFEYHLGDGLVYTAMAMGYENATLQDSPIANTNYAFSLAIAMEPPTVLTSDVTGITLTTANCGGTVITEGDAPVTARGVCWATTPSPLATGSHTTDGSGTGAFVSNMTGLTVGTYYYVRAYAATSVDTSYGDELCFYTFFPCGSAITKNHIAGAVAPVSKTVTYGTVTNIPGEPAKCWITSNLGADHQATAVDDTTEASAGWYWQFNRKQGFKHDGSTRTPNTTWIENIPAATNWLPANDPCALEFGSDWRLPTGTEWTNVDASGGWTNWNGPWNSGLKLHTAGYLDYNNGSRLKRGIAGHYWSSRSYDFYDGWQLSFEINKSLIYNRYIAFGYSVRCLREAGDQATLPIITTASITYITQSTAISGGNVTSDGGALVTARGVCWSTSANPTIANSYTISGDETGLFASNITELSENTLYYVRAYATNSVGTAYGDELLFYTLPIFSCGSAITINHIAGAIAPINKTVTYSTVTNIPGEPNKCWITSNLGADHQATTVDDTTASSAGWYWQFNRKQGFQIDGTMLIPEEKWVYWELIENCNWYHSNDPCGYELGGSWRIPTYTEWYNVDISGNWHDWAGPWDSGLKLHAAGIIYYYSFGIQFESLIGGYWSTDQSQSDSHYGYGLVFTSDYSKLKNDLYKGYGLSVRCLRD